MAKELTFNDVARWLQQFNYQDHEGNDRTLPYGVKAALLPALVQWLEVPVTRLTRRLTHEERVQVYMARQSTPLKAPWWIRMFGNPTSNLYKSLTGDDGTDDGVLDVPNPDTGKFGISAYTWWSWTPLATRHRLTSLYVAQHENGKVERLYDNERMPLWSRLAPFIKGEVAS